MEGRPVADSQPTPITKGALERMTADAQPQMIDGTPFRVDGELDVDPAELLRKVVGAVIETGHASDLYEFPEVLAFFNAKLPPAERPSHPAT